MRKLILTATSLMLANPGLAQGIATEEEPLEPELRRYSVELIVFAYAEDVATGSELFLPEVVEVEPAADIDTDAEPWPLEGPLADDSLPTDVEDEDVDDASEAAAETDGEDGFLYNENGERVNENGQLVDENGQVIGEFDPYALRVFDEDELTMIDTWDRLDRLDAYEPLLHVGWAQPGLPEAATEAIALETFGSQVAGLEGAFTLYLSRYLHLVVDLELAARRGENADEFADDMPDEAGRELTYEETVALYTEASRRSPASPRPGQRFPGDALAGDDQNAYETAPAPVLKVLPLKYAISENRIVNSGDVRYFDHPKFGVIAKIERVELPEPAEPSDDTDVLLPVGGQ